MEMGFTFLKMDLGIGMLIDEPGALTAPLGFLEEMKTYASHSSMRRMAPWTFRK